MVCREEIVLEGHKESKLGSFNDTLGLIKYIKTDDEGHNCPICMSQLMYMYDGVSGLFKCLECGYSRKQNSALAGQHRYDLPVTILSARSLKKAWFELHQPMDEKLFNILVQHDWSPNQAIKDVIKDLNLSEEESFHFLEKIQSLTKE